MLNVGLAASEDARRRKTNPAPAKAAPAKPVVKARTEAPLAPSDFAGLNFTMDAFQRGIDGDNVVQTRNGGFVELATAMNAVTAKTGKRDFRIAKSRSDYEAIPERAIAQGMAQRAKGSMVGRAMEAQRAGQPKSAASAAGFGMVSGGIDQILRGFGGLADVVDSGNVGNALDHATNRQGVALNQTERQRMMADYGTKALGVLGDAGPAAGAAGPIGSLFKAVSGLGNGLGYAQKTATLADPTQPDAARWDAAKGLVGDVAKAKVPAAIGFVARLGGVPRIAAMSDALQNRVAFIAAAMNRGEGVDEGQILRVLHDAHVEAQARGAGQSIRVEPHYGGPVQGPPTAPVRTVVGTAAPGTLIDPSRRVRRGAYLPVKTTGAYLPAKRS